MAGRGFARSERLARKGHVELGAESEPVERLAEDAERPGAPPILLFRLEGERVDAQSNGKLWREQPAETCEAPESRVSIGIDRRERLSMAGRGASSG